MPTRYLKPGIRDSELINRLKPAAEVLFYRLLVTVDDFGRTDARPAMIKAACFPIKDEVDAVGCEQLLVELADVGLIDLYSVAEKPFLQLRKWDNQPRAKESKFPAPADGCAHVHTDARKPRTVLPETETGTGTGTGTGTPLAPRRRGGGSERFDEFWTAWPRCERKQDRAKCLEHWKRHDLDGVAETILADVRTKRATEKWRDGYIEAPLVYLRGRRWEDGVVPASAAPAEVLDWRSSWKTIVAKGEAVGCGAWSEELLAQGKVPPFPVYRARVEKRVAEIEGGPEVDPQGQKKIAEIVGGIGSRRVA